MERNIGNKGGKGLREGRRVEQRNSKGREEKEEKRGRVKERAREKEGDRKKGGLIDMKGIKR